MDKLEYYIVRYLQECLKIDNLSINPEGRYIELDNELIYIIKGKGENELYVVTECNLNNMGSDLMTYVKITSNIYKVDWTQIFRFLIGEIDESLVDQALVTKELKLIQVSSQPLTNFLKSK